MSAGRPLRIATAPPVEPPLLSAAAADPALPQQVTGQLALALPDPARPGHAPAGHSPVRTGAAPAGPGDHPDWVRAGCPSDPAAFTRAAAQAVLEIALGARPASQAVRWCAQDVYAALARRGVVAARRRAAAGTRLARSNTRAGASGAPGGSHPQPPPIVRSVRTCVLGATRVESSAVMVHHGRARAIAFRLDCVRGRWIVTTLVIG